MKVHRAGPHRERDSVGRGIGGTKNLKITVVQLIVRFMVKLIIIKLIFTRKSWHFPQSFNAMRDEAVQLLCRAESASDFGRSPAAMCCQSAFTYRL